MQRETLQAFFERDRFAQFVGLDLVDVSPGRAMVRLAVRDHHRNGVGLVHGAVLFTLADFAFAVASNSHGRTALGINVSMAYHQAARDGNLLAEAMEIHSNNTLATYQVEIRDEAGSLIATFLGTAYRKREPRPGKAMGEVPKQWEE
ncbi:MAG: PaaI family thioesterase [Desulfacinum sp.]|jgi:acyl-CoA thioesterase|nr:PaaI family thioesterase [Desulfacinum sp.]